MQLGQLNHMKHLGVGGFSQQESEMAILCDILKNLSSSLRSLDVCVEEGQRIVSLDILEEVSPAPPLLLRNLKFSGILMRLPGWFRFLNDVERIALERTYLEEDAMEILQTLPNLIQLDLLNDSFMGNWLDFGAEDFPSLIKLRLKDLPQLNMFRFIRENHRPLKVYINSCPNLNYIQISPGGEI